MIEVVGSWLLGLTIIASAGFAHVLSFTGRGQVGQWLKTQQWLPRLELGLAVSGAAFLAGGGVGGGVRTVAGFADQLAANLAGGQLTVQIVSYLVGLAAVAGLVYGLVVNRVTWYTAASAGLLPSLLYAIPGWVGIGLGAAITWVASHVGDVFTRLFGIS